MVVVEAFTHYVALNPVPHCNAYHAYTTLYEHRIAKFGLHEILVTDSGTEFKHTKFYPQKIKKNTQKETPLLRLLLSSPKENHLKSSRF